MEGYGAGRCTITEDFPHVSYIISFYESDTFKFDFCISSGSISLKTRLGVKCLGFGICFEVVLIKRKVNFEFIDIQIFK